jgi:hypothetical protein
MRSQHGSCDGASTGSAVERSFLAVVMLMSAI